MFRRGLLVSPVILYLLPTLLAILFPLAVIFFINDGETAVNKQQDSDPLKEEYKEIAAKYGIPVDILAGVHKLDPQYKQDIARLFEPGNDKYDKIFFEAGEQTGVDPLLLKAVAAIESSYNPKTKSSAGARGLMQLMPATCKQYGLSPDGDCYDPQKNILAGAKHLSGYIKANDGDLILGLASYNAGPGRVKKAKGVPNIKETQNYVKKVPEKYEELKKQRPKGGIDVEKKLDKLGSDLAKSIKEFEKNPCKTPQKMTNPSLGCAIFAYTKSWDSVDHLIGAPVYKGGKIPYPLSNFRISDEFGRRGGKHMGMDLAAPLGTPIYAVADGTVVRSSEASGYGWLVVIDHGGGFQTAYAHMYPQNCFVKANQKIQKGQKIALVGSNGRSTGPHLHFEVIEKGKKVNPRKYL